jgi:hypothetical protein
METLLSLLVSMCYLALDGCAHVVIYHVVIYHG